MASLVPDYGTSQSESSSDESDSENVNKTSTDSSTMQGKLPLPSFTGLNPVPVTSSVFINPFVQAEKAEEAVLEKHVKMIPTKESIKSINGKKICWMYRKGRCRFGHNCKYAHDSDVFNSVSDEKNDETSSNILCSGDNENDPKINTPSNGSVEKKGKKRPGLCQGLKPGKKVMKMYIKQKKE